MPDAKKTLTEAPAGKLRASSRAFRNDATGFSLVPGLLSFPEGETKTDCAPACSVKNKISAKKKVLIMSQLVLVYFNMTSKSFFRFSGNTFNVTIFPFFNTPSTVVLYGACNLNETSQFAGHAGNRYIFLSTVCISIS